MSSRRVREGAWLAFTLVGLAPLAGSQKGSRPAAPAPAVDPYTHGEAAALERLGYRSFGPFRFGAETNEVVQSRLGGVPILWVETEHFRLGSSLGEYRAELPAEVAGLRRELAELRELVESIPAKAKKLDPWLRLHLFARRLERLHAELCARLGVLDRPAGEGVSTEGAALVLGMKDKFAVLLTQKKSSLARFTREYCGTESGDAVLYDFPATGALFYGRSEESVGLADSDLHYAVVHGVVQNLLCGIQGYPHALPAWWQHGLALWFAREREPRGLLFVRPSNEALPPEQLSDWEPLVRARVEGQACLTWSEMLARPTWLEQPFGDNIVLWSRLDFLLQREGVAPALARELHQLGPDLPSGELALGRATGLDLAALDHDWSEWVMESYRKKHR